MSTPKDSGMALVLVLVLVALLVSIVGEFVYTVYTSSSQLKAWQEVEEMGSLASSAMDTGRDIFAQKVSGLSWTYPEEITIPIAFEEETATVTIRDLQSRINLNALVFPNGTTNERLLKASKRLLERIGLPTEVLDRIADWVDPDSEGRLPDSEDGAKNGPLVVFDELYWIPKIKKEQIDRMKEFFTVYPDRSGLSEKVNINTAPAEVIMAMAEGITEQMAQEAVQKRQDGPFRRCSDIKAIAGFEAVYPEFSALCTVKSSFFEIEARAQKGQITTVLKETIRVDGASAKVLSFREF